MKSLREGDSEAKGTGSAKDILAGGYSRHPQAASFVPDLNQAQRYKDVLAGAEGVTLQTFSDREALKVRREDGTLHDPYARIMHGQLVEHFATLTDLNRLGVGIFVMVNAGDRKGRKAKNVVRVRALFIDTDGAPYPKWLPLRPHLVVMSSPGRWHLYWLVVDVPLDQFTTLQRALAEHYGTDLSVSDLPRVMRLPGFYHCKGELVMTQLLEANDHAPYSFAEVRKAWPFLTRALDAAKRQTEEKAHRKPTSVAPQQAQRLLETFYDAVATALEGQRHDTLKRYSRAAGGFVGSGTLTLEEARETLAAAAEVCGLPESEAAGVILWGLTKGAAAPLELGGVSLGALTPFWAADSAPKDSRLGRGKPTLGHSGSRYPSGPKLGGKPCL